MTLETAVGATVFPLLPLACPRLLLRSAFVTEFAARRLCALLVVVRRGPVRAVTAIVPGVTTLFSSVGHNLSPPSVATLQGCHNVSETVQSFQA